VSTEIHHIIRTAETIYRVRPDPDFHAVDGSEGVVIEWSDDGGKTWDGMLSIAADALDGVAKALGSYATSVKKD
jgi:hypothetical protein